MPEAEGSDDCTACRQTESIPEELIELEMLRQIALDWGEKLMGNVLDDFVTEHYGNGDLEAKKTWLRKRLGRKIEQMDQELSLSGAQPLDYFKMPPE